MQRAAVFVFPPVEDFGIVPVEAQAAGVPVVTGPVGGQIETYVNGVSGVTAASTDAVDLADAISKARSLATFDARVATERFHEDIFAAKIRGFVGVEHEVKHLRRPRMSRSPSSGHVTSAA